jgi:hypothetical protein
MTDLSIGYSGGSGGFLLLHLLLLSDQYHVKFQDNKSFDEVIDQQWKITDPNQWKSSETWPDNLQTYNSQTLLNKIYFYCNPYNDQDWGQYSTSTIILYTDYRSQILLSHYKKAHWYCKKDQLGLNLKFSAYRKLLKNWKNHYNNIKDSQWPKCPSFRAIDKLPESIQKEILDNEYTAEYLNYQYHEPVDKYCNQWVLDAVIPLLNSADIVIRLQDLVNSNGAVLEEVLKIPSINSRQLQLLADWKKLHTPELLDKIGITA